MTDTTHKMETSKMRCFVGGRFTVYYQTSCSCGYKSEMSASRMHTVEDYRKHAK